MLFKGAGLGDERAFGSYRNVEASSITTGMGVELRVAGGASFDGTQVIRSGGNGNDIQSFLGIATQDIATNRYGLVQVYGPCASVLLSNTGTSLTINVGDPLVPGGQAGGLFSGAPTYANSGFCFVIASNTPLAISGSAYASGFIRHGM